MPELTDLSVIRALCEKYDFALSKGFGQNFIINPGLPPKIVDASGVDKRYGVIEIGPGIGVLTRELAKRAAKVVSIEVDERLPPLLAETMAGVDNFKLILQDVLKVDLKALIAEEFPGMPVAVCANLPYYITSPIVMKLLGDRLPIESLTVMVQKEAADRLAAAPGTRASSAISCAVSYYATSKMMFTAAPGSFYPAPKVTSAVVRMEIRPQPAVQVEDEEGYFALVRAAFGQRRKTAANAIASGLGMPKDAVTAAMEAAGLAPAAEGGIAEELLRRPEISYPLVAGIIGWGEEITPMLAERLETEIKYAGYIARQDRMIREVARHEKTLIPEDFEYAALTGLTLEAREKLARIRPRNLGQAGRIPGVSPSDVAQLSIALAGKQQNNTKFR